MNARAIIERETASGMEIVLQTRDKPHEGGTWLGLPGGRVEEYESLVAALAREVREEIGLTVAQVAAWMAADPGRFSWVDRAGLRFYVQHLAA